MAQVLDTLTVCTTCLFAIEYGNYDGADRLQTEATRKGIEWYQNMGFPRKAYLTAGRADMGYSRASCEVCGIARAGDRHEVIVLLD